MRELVQGSTFSAAAYVLDHPTLAMYVNGNINEGDEIIEFDKILDRVHMMSGGEQVLVKIAHSLYNGSAEVDLYNDLGQIDDATYARVMEALCAKRKIVADPRLEVATTALEGIAHFAGGTASSEATRTLQELGAWGPVTEDPDELDIERLNFAARWLYDQAHGRGFRAGEQQGASVQALNDARDLLDKIIRMLDVLANSEITDEAKRMALWVETLLGIVPQFNVAVHLAQVRHGLEAPLLRQGIRHALAQAQLARKEIRNG